MTSNQMDVLAPPEPAQCVCSQAHAHADMHLQTQQRIESYLMSRYGPVLDTPALAEVLRFKTVTALEKSMERGHLPIRCMDTPHRRGTYVLVADVAAYLVSSTPEVTIEPQPSPSA
ncbi:hypothetical protein ACSFA2_17630 [Variovorax sp. LT2P21]|uniref:hypothetical protein n=1 Tax=Variovorax sp. LT2P21 TaxID=3443731 RepID=UPI003F489831